MMVRTQRFQYIGARGKLASAEVALPETGDTLPVVVVCHGYKGFMDWGFFPYLSAKIAEGGSAVLRFNFSHNGCDSEGNEERDLDAFRENTFSIEEHDLKIILDGVRTRTIPLGERFDASRLTLLGHSRGGSSVIRCATDPGVNGLVLLASVCRYPQVTAEEEKEWRATGAHWVENYRTKTRLPHALPILEEMIADKDLILDRMSKVEVPVCIIHGTSDVSVPPEAANELKARAPQAEVHLLANADHTFGIKHPFERTSDDLEAVLTLIKNFLNRL